MEQLLGIRNLRVWFDVRMGLLAGLAGREEKHVRAVDGISFDVRRGEVFCLVGESGCGKTTTGKALLRLNDPTDGNVFFDVPEKDWNRLLAMEKRLQDLEPLVAKLTPEERKKAKTAWGRVRQLKRRMEAIQNPRSTAAVQARRRRLEKTIEILDVREKALHEGADTAVARRMAASRARIEAMRTLGLWFTPKRRRRLERLESELKETRYLLLRAEATHARTSQLTRIVHRLERRVARMRGHIHLGDPATLQATDGLQRELAVNEREMTGFELERLSEERTRHRAGLATLESPNSSGADADLRTMETAIEEIRGHGGPGLEARELRAKIDELRDLYDLATWGAKRRLKVHGRSRRRKLLKKRMRNLRRRMQIIYQDPYESLNPKLSIYDIVAEPLLANRVVATHSEAEAVVAKVLEDVGLRPASEFMLRYPHELSGGQRQRVGIATALVVDPEFIVADEPVSMLDASVRTEILALLLDLKKGRDLTYLFITHDLGLAWILADRIAVMYLGKIVETGDGAEIIQNPRHPYTKALISVVPSPNPKIRREKIILHGERPNPVEIPSGCRFHPRCPMAVGICGWDSEEVSEALRKLFVEDRENYPEARTISDVAATGPFGLTVRTSDPTAVETYLWKRLQAIALGRPALGAIRKASPSTGSLQLTLHEPVEPPLRLIKGDISVACHLVEPEIAEAGTEVVVPEAVAIAK